MRPDHACKTLNDGLVNLEKVRAFVKLLDVPNTSQAPVNRPMWRTTGRHQVTSFMKHSQSPHLPVHHVCTGGLQHNGTWPLCLEELSQPCLVYSFGIANEWTFDEAAADAGCEVHSFDPTLASLSTAGTSTEASRSTHGGCRAICPTAVAARKIARRPVGMESCLTTCSPCAPSCDALVTRSVESPC